ncbi:hypothetical protein GCM10010431_71930 [Streptomyces kunmingensis]
MRRLRFARGGGMYRVRFARGDRVHRGRFVLAAACAGMGCLAAAGRWGFSRSSPRP